MKASIDIEIPDGLDAVRWGNVWPLSEGEFVLSSNDGLWNNSHDTGQTGLIVRCSQGYTTAVNDAGLLVVTKTYDQPLILEVEVKTDREAAILIAGCRRNGYTFRERTPTGTAEPASASTALPSA